MNCHCNTEHHDPNCHIDHTLSILEADIAFPQRGRQKGIAMPPAKGVILSRMAMQEAKAWQSLARYKFWMFGYHAAQWVMLASLLSPKPANPFGEAVRLARRKVLERRSR